MLLGNCGAGDVITSINDRKVTKAADLAIALDSFQVGDTVTLKVRRGDEGSQVQCCSCCLYGSVISCLGQCVVANIYAMTLLILKMKEPCFSHTFNSAAK